MRCVFYDKQLVGIYDEVGGIETFRRISNRFHRKVDLDPALRQLFPKNMAALEERLALFLAERTGGGAGYSQARGKTSLICKHAHLAIGSEEADHWLAHMSASLEEEGLCEAISARLLSNLSTLAHALGDPLIHLYRMPLSTLHEKLIEDPSLVLWNDYGRNLICAAAIAWDVPRLHLLLEFGADIEMKDTGGHNALYRIANGAGNEEDGLAALDLLVAHGANVNQISGVGGMTPLHMSARRGTKALAEALLLAGAKIEARDSKGETPLRRAVNCRKEGIIQLLISNGADPHSEDRFGRTVLQAARDPRIRDLLKGD